jgi:hypothetical protein
LASASTCRHPLLAVRVLELDPVMLELDRIAERWYGKKPKRT